MHACAAFRQLQGAFTRLQHSRRRVRLPATPGRDGMMRWVEARWLRMLATLLGIALWSASALAQGDTTVTLQHGGVARMYRLHVPAKYNPASPAPLLVALH